MLMPGAAEGFRGGSQNEVPAVSDETKPMEIELKLILPGPEAESAVVACMREHGYLVEELDPVRNVDTYLDTFDWSLMKNKIALRYRISNGTAMYTLKSTGSIKDGIAKRMETEIPLKEPVDGPARVPVKRIRKHIEGMIWPRKLLEHIQIRTDRRRYRVLTSEEAEIELAFDSSIFSLRGLHKTRRTQRLHELEAEILEGPATALGSLAALLAEAFGYSPSTASKLEVAIERLKVGMPSKKLPEKLMVRLEDRFDLAVSKILAYQLQRFREQLPGVRRDIDTEFVHQARVATRRMRSALRLFHDAVPENTGAYLAEELKWLGGMFGTVRDLDVFLLNLSRFEGQIKCFPGRKKKAFENWIEKHRRAPLKALQEALDSIRYKNLERRITRFLERPLPARPQAPLAVKPVRDVAPVLIHENFEAVMAQGHKVLADPKLKQFHRLRIQMKKLRYAAEFMAPAYNGGLDPFIERTVEIQDCLGELQDTVFTGGFVESLLDDWKGKLVDPDLVFILGEIYQLQAEIARVRQEMFGRIWERFSSGETLTLLKETLLGQTAAE
jgi:inorganic triphosphatase YgiF